MHFELREKGESNKQEDAKWNYLLISVSISRIVTPTKVEYTFDG